MLDTLNLNLKSYSELFKMYHIEYIIYIPVIMLSRALREGVHKLYTNITIKYDKWFEKRLELHIKRKTLVLLSRDKRGTEKKCLLR